MVAEKSLLLPFLPSATLISRLNKSFDGILCAWLFDVLPAASNTGGIQTVKSQNGRNSTVAGALNSSGAGWQRLAGPKMLTQQARRQLNPSALPWRGSAGSAFLSADFIKLLQTNKPSSPPAFDHCAKRKITRLKALHSRNIWDYKEVGIARESSTVISGC